MEQELPRLVRKSQKGDREAFTQLLLECEQMLSRVAMAILQDPEDAADAVQDAHPAEQVLPHRRPAQ